MGPSRDPELSSIGESGIVTFSKSTCVEQSCYSAWSRTSSVVQVLFNQRRRALLDSEENHPFLTEVLGLRDSQYINIYRNGEY